MALLKHAEDGCYASDVVRNETVEVGRATDASHAEHAADGELEVVGEDPGGEPLGQGRQGQRAPLHARVDPGPAGVDRVDGVEGPRVDDDAAERLGLTEARVRLAAHGHRDPVPIGEADRALDVPDGAGLQERRRSALDEMTEVRGADVEGRGVEEQLSVEARDSNRSGTALSCRVPEPALPGRIEGHHCRRSGGPGE